MHYKKFYSFLHVQLKTLLSIIIYLIIPLSIFSQDTLIIKPDKPEWGDTLHIELHPDSNRGALYLSYIFEYPFGELRTGWKKFFKQDGMYKSSIVVDNNSIVIFIEVKGTYYLKTPCSSLPYKKVEIYANDGNLAKVILGDTSDIIIYKWLELLYTKQDGDKIISDIKEIEKKKSKGLLDCYLIAKGYLLTGKYEKANDYLLRMYKINQNSPLILKLADNIYKQSPGRIEGLKDSIINFIFKNPEKIVHWEDYVYIYRDVTDNIARKFFNLWHLHEPENPIPLYSLAELSKREEKYKESLEYINMAISLAKEDFLIIYSFRGFVYLYSRIFYKIRGELLEKSGDIKLAIEDYKKSLEYDASTRVALPLYGKLGTLYLELDQFDKSEHFQFKAFMAGDTTGRLKEFYTKEYSNKMNFHEYLSKLYHQWKEEYEMSPDSKLTDIENHKINLSDLRGNIVVLYFWDMRCKASVDIIPDLNKLYEKYKNENVKFLAPGSSDKEFLKSHPFKFKTCRQSLEIFNSFGITNTPYYFIISPDGHIVYKGIGSSKTTCKELDRVIERILMIR